jgi:hypothetical protein
LYENTLQNQKGSVGCFSVADSLDAGKSSGGFAVAKVFK